MKEFIDKLKTTMVFGVPLLYIIPAVLVLGVLLFKKMKTSARRRRILAKARRAKKRKGRK